MKNERWFDAQGRPTRFAREVYATALLSNTLEELPAELLAYARTHPEFEVEVLSLVEVLRLRRATPTPPPQPNLRGVLVYGAVLLAVLTLTFLASRLLRQPPTTPQPLQPASSTLPPTPTESLPSPPPAPVPVPPPAAKPVPPPAPKPVSEPIVQRTERAADPLAQAAPITRDSSAFIPDSATERRLLKYAFGQPRELYARTMRSNDFLLEKGSSIPALVLTCEQVGTGLPLRVRCACSEHPFLDGQQVWLLKIYSNRRQRLSVRELKLQPNFEIEIGGGEAPGLYYWTLITPESDGRVAWEGRYVVE